MAEVRRRRPDGDLPPVVPASIRVSADEEACVGRHDGGNGAHGNPDFGKTARLLPAQGIDNAQAKKMPRRNGAFFFYATES